MSDAVARVLAGKDSYDDLLGEDQANERAQWDQQLADDVASLDLTDSLRTSGKPFHTADADGNVITHGTRNPPR